MTATLCFTQLGLIYTLEAESSRLLWNYISSKSTDLRNHSHIFGIPCVQKYYFLFFAQESYTAKSGYSFVCFWLFNT